MYGKKRPCVALYTTRTSEIRLSDRKVRIGAQRLRFPEFLVDGLPDFVDLLVLEKFQKQDANKHAEKPGKESLQEYADKGLGIENVVQEGEAGIRDKAHEYGDRKTVEESPQDRSGEPAEIAMENGP